VSPIGRISGRHTFERLAERLKALGFARPEAHHFVSPEGAEVDLLPYGEGVVADDTIVWPDGTVMSALGMEEAFAASVEREVAPRLTARLVTPPGLVVMKIVDAASRDRSPASSSGRFSPRSRTNMRSR
jgi:predicted nucleotidyltransferase